MVPLWRWEPLSLAQTPWYTIMDIPQYFFWLPLWREQPIMWKYVSGINTELKLQVEKGDTGIFLSVSLTGNLFCYSWKVINLHCERILLLVATLPCKVHYMEMLQAIKQKRQICVHFKLNFHYSSFFSSLSLLLYHLRSYFHRTWKLICTGNLKEMFKSTTKLWKTAPSLLVFRDFYPNNVTQCSEKAAVLCKDIMPRMLPEAKPWRS